MHNCKVIPHFSDAKLGKKNSGLSFESTGYIQNLWLICVNVVVLASEVRYQTVLDAEVELLVD